MNLPKDLKDIIISYFPKVDEIILFLNDDNEKTKFFESILKKKFGVKSVEIFKEFKKYNKEDFSFKFAYNSFIVSEQKTFQDITNTLHELEDVLIYKILSGNWGLRNLELNAHTVSHISFL